MNSGSNKIDNCLNQNESQTFKRLNEIMELIVFK